MTDSFKSLTELAELLAMPEGLALVRKLQETGAIGFEPERKMADEGMQNLPDGPYRNISIWEPKQTPSGWEFQRPEPGPFGDHFSQRMRIPVEKPVGTRRIAFFGESVAAGYLYAPHLTPALVLESILKIAFPQHAIEVLDFSRTNETLDAMKRTAKAALQVDPDLMIFFAGNNFPLLELTEFTPHNPSVGVRQALGRHWRESGMLGVKDEEQRLLTRRVGGALTDLAEWLVARDLPAIWMIPEVNLLDWDHAQPPPWLPGYGLRDWYDLLAQARDAMANKAFEQVITCAWSMLELDGGSCPVAYRLLGLANHALGKLDQAREAFRYEIQASGYSGSCFLGAPQVTTQMRTLIKSVWCRYHLDVVDLAEVFQAKYPDSLPDRRLFLDYCHLTKEAMTVAMAALPLIIAKNLKFEAPLNASEAAVMEVPPQVDSLAYLGAAIHSSHRQFPIFPERTPWRFWLEKAIRNDSTATRKLCNYATLRVRPAPPVFTEIQDRELKRSAPFTPQHGWFYDYIDGPFLKTCFEILGVLDKSRAESVLEELLTWQFDRLESTDLIDPPYFLWEPLARFMPDVMPRTALPKSAHLRCPWPETRFALVADGRTDMQLNLTMRLPWVAEKDFRSWVTLHLDGGLVAQIEVGNQWQNHPVFLEGKRMKRGLNCLAITWPMPYLDSVEDMTQNLLLGRHASFHPHFGEIFSIHVEKV